MTSAFPGSEGDVRTRASALGWRLTRYAPNNLTVEGRVIGEQHICRGGALFPVQHREVIWLRRLADSQWIRPHLAMATMNISLPDSLKDFIDEQVEQGGYSTTAEYIRELVLRDQGRVRLRTRLLAGAASAPGTAVDHADFEGRRRRISSAERKKVLDQVVAASEDVDGYDLS